MVKNNDSLCWCCIYYQHLKEKTTPGSLNFPAHPYCKKGHTKADFRCKDFETTRELIKNRLDCLESQIKLLEERLASKKE